MVLGHCPLTAKIAGSIPAGGNRKKHVLFYSLVWFMALPSSRPTWQFRPQSGQARPQWSWWFKPQWWQSTGTRPNTPWWQSSGSRPSVNREKWSFRIFKNEEIKAPKILLLDEQGERIGIVTRFEALKKAEEAWLDLVQVAYNAEDMTATAKIIDFGKHQYEKKKTENEKKKASKSKWQKEIKFGYNIGDNDLQMKVDQAKKMLSEGYIVKMIAKLKWREKAYKEIVRLKFDYIEDELNKIGKSQGIKAEESGFTITVMSKKN